MSRAGLTAALTGAEDGVHDALNRMRKAAERGTGCHLTADMIASLSISTIGQMWHEPDPRDAGRTFLAATDADRKP